MGGVASKTARAVAYMWKKNLGLDVEIMLYEWKDFLRELREGKFEVFGPVGWLADFPHPENFIGFLFHSRSEENHTNYENKKVDLLIEEARRTGDPEIYSRAEKLIIEDMPIIPLFFPKSFYLVKPYIKYEPPPIIIPHLRYIRRGDES